jgi:predicted membrane protein
MTDDGIRHNGPRLFLGLIVIAIGVLFTLDKLGYVNAGEFWAYWPVILIAIGLGRAVQPCGTHGRGFGIFLIVLGVWLLLSNLDVISYRIWDFWPILLVLLGIMMVWRAATGPRWESRRGRLDHAVPTRMDHGVEAVSGETGEGPAAAASTKPEPQDAATVNGFALLGGVKRKCVSQEFRGGELTAIMGGCELDLRGASIGGGQAVIDTFAFMGGIEIKVPPEWSVVVQGTPVFGAFDDKTVRAGRTTGQVLVIKGTAFMGGVEVKN